MLVLADIFWDFLEWLNWLMIYCLSLNYMAYNIFYDIECYINKLNVSIVGILWS